MLNIICARLLFASGIGKIKYIYDYNNDELVGILSNQCNVKIIKI